MNLLIHNKNKTNVRQFICFCIVGSICTALDVIIFYSLRTVAKYPVALVSAYCISLVVNYFFSIYWTFSTKPSVKNFIGVIIVHLFNLFVIRIGLMYLFVNIIMVCDKIAYIPTLFISVLISFVLMKGMISKL